MLESNEIFKNFYYSLQNWPYADRLSGNFEGFVVDLMNEIANIAGFEYRLYFSPDGKYGSIQDGRVNGMIGEVFNNVSINNSYKGKSFQDLKIFQKD